MPATTDTQKRPRLTIRIDEVTDRELTESAKKNKRSKNAEVEVALERYLLDRGEQN